LAAVDTGVAAEVIGRNLTRQAPQTASGSSIAVLATVFAFTVAAAAIREIIAGTKWIVGLW